MEFKNHDLATSADHPGVSIEEMPVRAVLRQAVAPLTIFWSP